VRLNPIQGFTSTLKEIKLERSRTLLVDWECILMNRDSHWGPTVRFLGHSNLFKINPLIRAMDACWSTFFIQECVDSKSRMLVRWVGGKRKGGVIHTIWYTIRSHFTSLDDEDYFEKRDIFTETRRKQMRTNKKWNTDSHFDRMCYFIDSKIFFLDFCCCFATK